MGKLIGGQWTESDALLRGDGASPGRFVRRPTSFRDRVTRDESSEFPAVTGRYHLYVSHACPWAHRTLIVRTLRKLEDVVSISVVHPEMGDRGWTFQDGPGVIPDTVNGLDHLWKVYTRARADYTGRVTVPILWDKQTGRIVNNESREIIQMFDEAFAELGDPTVNLRPPELAADIDQVIDAIYEPINNGVYRTGFAGTQQAYDEAVGELFDALDYWETVLSKQRYLCGDILTEADICLFSTLYRFDPVYHCHFKCNVKRIVDYPNLWGFTRDVYQQPGVAGTCHLDHITRHYYWSHTSLNPRRIVARGPTLDYDAPHGRERSG